MRKGMLKSIADSRKIKYSTLSLALCAVVVAVVIIFNSIISVLASSLGWYVDMTDRQMFTLSDGAKAHLNSINKEIEIEIIFPLDKDQVETEYAVSSSSGSIGHIYKTAFEIAQECENVTLSYHDTVKDYGTFYKENGLQEHAKSGHILIVRKDENGKYATGDLRSYPINYFFVSKSATDSTLYAYNGELVFLSALIAMSRDDVPTVYFTVGHGENSFLLEDEKVKEEGLSYSSLASAAANGIVSGKAYNLMQIFADSGFRIKPIDLRLEDIPADARMMVINQPSADFTEDELYKLTTYLQNGGATFCFTPYDIELPSLYETLRANYGVTVNTSNTPVEDNRTMVTNKLDVGGGATVTLKHYLANVSMHDNGFASLKYFSAYTNYSSANAYYNKAGSIDIEDKYMTQTGLQTGGYTKYTYPLLETSSSAEFMGVRKNHTLMSITSIDNWSVEDENSRYSYLVVCPSSDFVSAEALSVSSVNRHMMLSLIQSTSSVQTPVNLDYKPFVEYKLTLTDAQARTITVVLATILPLIITACGVVVLVRRKHR